ncbi:putative glycosyltransferase [Thiorhodovibrio winogradskyi]|uniref:Glycosyltransferase n=1 Tax=Thiorhodovibrio winogradskyi TaxID=77007 RepID=A0ABZ0S9S0_9GAMM|nr:PilZ domain-containing protein [Thiorhodovibrio winogradskyi]
MDSKNINRISDPEVIAKIITKHFKARGKLRLSTAAGDIKADTMMVDNDHFARYFLVDALPRLVGATLEEEEEIEISGTIASLYSWFRTQELNPIVEDGERYYEIPYPDTLYQLQRRGAFRTTLPPRLKPTITGQIENTDIEVESHSFDAILENLSATGAGMIVSGKTASLLREGAKLCKTRIRVTKILDVTVDAEVRNSRPGRGDGELILGLEFLRLPNKDAQTITRAVMELQRQILAAID